MRVSAYFFFNENSNSNYKPENRHTENNANLWNTSFVFFFLHWGNMFFFSSIFCINESMINESNQ